MTELQRPDAEDQYAPTEATRERWWSSQRAKLLILVPFALLLVLRAADDVVTLAIILIGGVLLAAIIIAVVRYQAHRRLRNLAPGVAWRGSAAMERKDFLTSPSLNGAAPRKGFRSFLAMPTDQVGGVLSLSAQSVSWRPDRLARFGGAQAWTLPLGEILAAEVGALPGTVLVRGSALRLALADQSSLSMVVPSPGGLPEALARLGIPGPGMSAPREAPFA